MQNSIQEFNQTLSQFVLSRRGSLNSGTLNPADWHNLNQNHTFVLEDEDEIQWSFSLETSVTLTFPPAGDPENIGITMGEPTFGDFRVKVKFADQEQWKEYDLGVFIEGIVVPSELLVIVEKVMASGLFNPLPRTSPKAPKRERGNQFLMVNGTELQTVLEKAGYITEADTHDEPVLTVSRPGEVFVDMNVYLEFRELNDDDTFGTLLLKGGSQETLSLKKDAGIFFTDHISTGEELLEALAKSFNAWESDMKAFS